jgi:hypothetical protein
MSRSSSPAAIPRNTTVRTDPVRSRASISTPSSRYSPESSLASESPAASSLEHRIVTTVCEVQLSKRCGRRFRSSSRTRSGSKSRSMISPVTPADGTSGLRGPTGFAIAQTSAPVSCDNCSSPTLSNNHEPPNTSSSGNEKRIVRSQNIAGDYRNPATIAKLTLERLRRSPTAKKPAPRCRGSGLMQKIY